MRLSISPPPLTLQGRCHSQYVIKSVGGKCSQKELVQHWTWDRMMLPGEIDGVERQSCEHQLLVSPTTLQVG